MGHANSASWITCLDGWRNSMSPSICRDTAVTGEELLAKQKAVLRDMPERDQEGIDR